MLTASAFNTDCENYSFLFFLFVLLFMVNKDKYKTTCLRSQHSYLDMNAVILNKHKQT